MPRKRKKNACKGEKNDSKPSINNQLRSTNYDKTFNFSKPGVPSETEVAPEPVANVEDDSKCERCMKNDTSKPSTDYVKTFYWGPSSSFKTKHKKMEKHNMLVLKDK